MTQAREEAHILAVQKAQAELKTRDPYLIAVNSGVLYKAHAPGQGIFTVPFWGQEYLVAFPDGRIEAADGSQPSVTAQILILHYLLQADGTPMADEWAAYRQFPGGLGYEAAFQARSGERLARAFGQDAVAFIQAARAAGGERLVFGDASFMFQVFPRVRMAVVLYLADSEFPAACNVLFDGAAHHYLPAEDLAVLGELLANRMLRAQKPSVEARNSPKMLC